MGKLSISHETIYRHLLRDKARGGELHRQLRGASKRYRKRYGRNDSRGRMAGQRHISERPEAATRRSASGHWEIDTVMGAHPSQHCIVTLNERRHGLVLIGKLRERTVAALNREVIHLIKHHRLPFKTITADNGTEFHGYADIEAATGAQFYFATPYHSWERAVTRTPTGSFASTCPKARRWPS